MCRRFSLRHLIVLLSLLAGGALGAACDSSKSAYEPPVDTCEPGQTGCPN